MTIDIAKYDASKDLVLRIFEGRWKNEPKRAIGFLAASLGVPCIVCAHWIGEATGYPPEIIESIKSLTEFYDYSEILNKPPNAPI